MSLSSYHVLLCFFFAGMQSENLFSIRQVAEAQAAFLSNASKDPSSHFNYGLSFGEKQLLLYFQ